MKARNLRIRCPDCGAEMLVDASTGAILEHQARSRGARIDLDRAADQLRRQEAERDSRFEQSMAVERDRDRLLEEKFEQAVRRARKQRETPAPVRDIDLD